MWMLFIPLAFSKIPISYDFENESFANSKENVSVTILEVRRSLDALDGPKFSVLVFMLNISQNHVEMDE